MPERSDCVEHDFVHAGVKYQVMEWRLSGGSAQPVYYYDMYFCRHCLEKRFERLAGEKITYDKIAYGASPLPRGVEPD